VRTWIVFTGNGGNNGNNGGLLPSVRVSAPTAAVEAMTLP
jgi:hypothetical protein